jgi:uncharacterized integral membrane protein
MLRVVGFVFILVVLMVFMGSNISNRCNIQFLGWVLQDVPVYITALSSFAAGMLAAIPVFISLQLRKKARQKLKQSREKVPEETAAPKDKNDEAN